MNASNKPCTPLTVTVTEAARLIGISRGGAYLAIARGELPAIRVGRRVLVPRRALQRLIDRGDTPAHEETR